MKTYREFISEGVSEIKTYFIDNNITCYKDTPEDKQRFINDVKSIKLGSTSEASKAWADFQKTREIFTPINTTASEEAASIIFTDADVKALSNSWNDIKVAYDKASAMTHKMFGSMKDYPKMEIGVAGGKAQKVETFIKNKDFPKHIDDIMSCVNSVLKHK